LHGKGRVMAIKDVLIVLTSYPDPTPLPYLDEAVALCQRLGARLSAIVCEVSYRVPRSVLGDALIDVSAMVGAEHAKSRDNAKSLLEAFRERATRHQVFRDAILEKCLASATADILVDHSRLYDLIVVPVTGDDAFTKFNTDWWLHSVIFGAGHPVLLLPRTLEARETGTLGTVAIAWDSSRPAARAIADSLPFLKIAKNVRIVTIVNEKTIETNRSVEDLARHLDLHGVETARDVVDAAGRKIGAVLEDYVGAHRVDLLVMGAYGHSRIQEFILGGATNSVLRQPPTRVLLSH
jgi:nucleotide-binding universal stress UspA family protein